MTATSRTLINQSVVLWGRMGVTSNRHWMITALLALFVAVFVFVPIADASACAVEVETAHTTSSAREPESSNNGTSGEHGLCAHGHCHHGGVVLPQPTQPVMARAVLIGAGLKPADAPPASHSPNGLKRPPRG